MEKSIKDQIIEWAKANYDKSHSAQTVIECWDDSDFEGFKSLKDFMKSYAEPKQDQYEDIRAEAIMY
jgi:hypothetical protein